MDMFFSLIKYFWKLLQNGVHNCWITRFKDDLWWKMTFGGRQSSLEDNLRWMTTFGGRWPSVENVLWWKTTFCGRRPSGKTTFSGRQPSLEDDLRWKTIYNIGVGRGKNKYTESIWTHCLHTLCCVAFLGSARWRICIEYTCAWLSHAHVRVAIATRTEI